MPCFYMFAVHYINFPQVGHRFLPPAALLGLLIVGVLLVLVRTRVVTRVRVVVCLAAISHCLQSYSQPYRYIGHR